MKLFASTHSPSKPHVSHPEYSMQNPTINRSDTREAEPRWRRATQNGFTAQQATDTVGVPHSTFYR